MQAAVPGHTDKETSWILASELRNAPELISDFHQAYPVWPGPLDWIERQVAETLPYAGRNMGDQLPTGT